MQAAVFEYGRHTENGGLYHGTDTQTHFLYSFYPFFFFLSLFCMLTWNFVSQFSQELFKLESWNWVYIWGMCAGLLAAEWGSLLLCFLYLSICKWVNLCHKFPRNCANYNLQTWHTYGEWIVVSWDMDVGSIVLFCHFTYFSFFPYVACQIWKFVSQLSREILKLESWNLVHI